MSPHTALPCVSRFSVRGSVPLCGRLGRDGVFGGAGSAEELVSLHGSRCDGVFGGTGSAEELVSLLRVSSFPRAGRSGWDPLRSATPWHTSLFQSQTNRLSSLSCP